MPGDIGAHGMPMGLFPWAHLLSYMLMIIADFSQFPPVEVDQERWAAMELIYGRWGKCPGFDLVVVQDIAEAM